MGYACNYKAGSPTFYYQGQNPSVGTLVLLSMLDNNGNPISTATMENYDFLWFHDFGPACNSSVLPAPIPSNGPRQHPIADQ
jgi:hypothetical protein